PISVPIFIWVVVSQVRFSLATGVGPTAFTGAPLLTAKTVENLARVSQGDVAWFPVVPYLTLHFHKLMGFTFSRNASFFMFQAMAPDGKNDHLLLLLKLEEPS